jgi:hypothetical protein
MGSIETTSNPNVATKPRAPEHSPIRNLPEYAHLTPAQRGALRTTSGNSPIASLTPESRQDMIKGVLERYADDGHLRHIAYDLGVARTALNQALLQYAPEAWKAAQGARALAELDDAEKAVEEATDNVAVSRAREKVKAAQWKLERTCRNIYGQDAPRDIGNSVSITLNLGPLSPSSVSDSRQGNVIEHD